MATKNGTTDRAVENRFPPQEIDPKEIAGEVLRVVRECCSAIRNHTAHAYHRQVLPDGREILRGSIYRGRRLDVLERDQYTCVRCGSRSELEVHHIVERGVARDDRMQNLETLCAGCHDVEHPERIPRRCSADRSRGLCAWRTDTA